jgi:hypothetical protein
MELFENPLVGQSGADNRRNLKIIEALYREACYSLLRHAANPIIPSPVPRSRREVGSGT